MNTWLCKLVVLTSLLPNWNAVFYPRSCLGRSLVVYLLGHCMYIYITLAFLKLSFGLYDQQIWGVSRKGLNRTNNLLFLHMHFSLLNSQSYSSKSDTYKKYLCTVGKRFRRFTPSSFFTCRPLGLILFIYLFIGTYMLGQS